MRVFSFAQESTRYCNYSKDKFGNDCTFIIPVWMGHLEEGKYSGIGQSLEFQYRDTIFVNSKKRIMTTEEMSYFHALEESELRYFDLLNQGWLPQQARSVLPNSLKTELIMTGTLEQWKEFFVLRTPGSAHPQARELAIPLKNEFETRGWLV